jgi:phosphonate transport system substrate-binding protein
MDLNYIQFVQFLKDNKMDSNFNNVQTSWTSVEQVIQDTEDFLSAVVAIRSLPGRENFLQDNDFSGTDLSNVLFAKNPDDPPLSLREANFIEADLRKANLNGLNLENAKFKEAELQEAQLIAVVAKGAVFSAAYLNKANLTEADLRDTEFYEAKLEGAILEKADLSNAKLNDANLKSANLENSIFINAELQGAILEDATLRGARLELANLKGTKINNKTQILAKWRIVWEIVNNQSSKNLLGQDLQEANLENVDLTKAKLRQADLIKASLKGADLSGADLSGAKLMQTALSRAILSNSNLVQADLSGAGLSRADLRGANLRAANLTGANLVGANLSGADLTDANLDGANFRDADLRNARLDRVGNSNFTGAIMDWVPQSPAPEQKVRPIVIGAIPDQNPEELEAIYNELAKYLSEKLAESEYNTQKLKIPFIYEKVANYQQAVEGLRNGSLDMVWFGGVTGRLAQKAVPSIQAIAQRNIDKEFASVFIARRDSGIGPIVENDLSVLRGKKFAFGDALSTSGAVMPLYYLKQQGFQTEDLLPQTHKIFSLSHDDTIKKVREGEVDLGVLNKQVWESRQNHPDNQNLQLIWTSPPFSDYHWVIHRGAAEPYLASFEKDLQPMFLPAVQKALIEIKDESILRAFGAKEFQEAWDNDYLSFDDILKDIISFLPEQVVKDINDTYKLSAGA